MGHRPSTDLGWEQSWSEKEESEAAGISEHLIVFVTHLQFIVLSCSYSHEPPLLSQLDSFNFMISM